MADFNRGDRSDPRRNFGNRSGFGGGREGGFGRGRYGGSDSNRRQMHKAVCAKCGNECEVPFIPSGDRPVYCNNCFDRNRDQNPRGSGGNFNRQEYRPRPQSGGGENYYKQFDTLNAKLDRIADMLSSMTPKQVVKDDKLLDISDIVIEKPAVKKEKKKRVIKKSDDAPKGEQPTKISPETT